MSEIRSIVRAAEALRREGTPFLIATVVRVQGSAYRRPGARMILTRDRWMAGSVSGGCLEGDVLKKGWWRTREGAPSLVTYDARDDEVGWGLGLGCDGVVDVLIERHGPGADPLLFLRRSIDLQERAAVATVFRVEGPVAQLGARVCAREHGALEPDALARASSPDVVEQMARACVAAVASGETAAHAYEAPGGRVEVLVESIAPPPRLFVFGAGHDAVPLVDLARVLGWETAVCAPHARFVTRERFTTVDEILVGPARGIFPHIDAAARAAVVLMAHDVDADRAALEAALASRAAYIGVLGPRRRTEKMLTQLGRADALDDPRLHAPLGLAIGAEGPREIALAAVAEIQAAFANGGAASLRDRSGAIHQAAE